MSKSPTSAGMIPLYNLGPLGGPKIIASKLKFPITVLSIFPENVHQRCRFYTTPWCIHHSQVFIAYGVSRTALNSVFRFIKMSDRDLKFVYLFCQTGTFPFELLFIPIRNVSILLALNLYILLNTEISWLPHFPMIKDCLCLITHLFWDASYIEDANRFKYSTEINKGWKLEVDIDDVKVGTGSGSDN